MLGGEKYPARRLGHKFSENATCECGLAWSKDQSDWKPCPPAMPEPPEPYDGEIPFKYRARALKMLEPGATIQSVATKMKISKAKVFETWAGYCAWREKQP